MIIKQKDRRLHYLLGSRSSEVEMRERNLHPFILGSNECVNALARMARLILQSGRREASVL